MFQKSRKLDAYRSALSKYTPAYGMAELPPPALLLDDRTPRQPGEGERGAAPRAADALVADPAARGVARREPVHARGPAPRADRRRPPRAGLRRRHLLARPRDAGRRQA